MLPCRIAMDEQAFLPENDFARLDAFELADLVRRVTGQPAMSVPLYWNARGLPIGSHFAGRFGDEATLFRLAGQLEQCRPWKARRPMVS
jgi:Asp-tRNA(Asn)/Glu-tRNA(Gln) amidotransferase A subunit family amidase